MSEAQAGGARRQEGTAVATGLADVPMFSIVIPIHNEEECLEREVGQLTAELDAQQVDYELLLAENGSSDNTLEIAGRLAEGNPRILALRIPAPDYGLAMKTGFLQGRGDLVVNFDIDYHSVPFLLEAARWLRDGRFGIVVGSKLMAGAEDKRALARRGISWGFTLLLRVLFDRHIDDTHGMKVLKREVVQEFAPQTVMTLDLFDTELIIRARRNGIIVKPIPVQCEEKRAARSSIAGRIPRTLKGLWRLRIILWKEKDAGY